MAAPRGGSRTVPPRAVYFLADAVVGPGQGWRTRLPQACLARYG